jgi:hypothetical protein
MGDHMEIFKRGHCTSLSLIDLAGIIDNELCRMLLSPIAAHVRSRPNFVV